MGENNLLCTFRDKQAEPTMFYWQLDAACAAIRPALLILDTAADLFGGNPREQIEVRQFVQFILGGLCKRYGSTVLLLMHPSAAGIASGEGAGFSVAWNNTLRSRLYLAHPRVDGHPDYTRAILSRKKANYASRGDELHLVRHDGTWALDADPPETIGAGRGLTTSCCVVR